MTTNRPPYTSAVPTAAEMPNPEVAPKAQRRQFSAAYKLRILHEADAATERGQIAALLRREGLYSSHLETWRNLRAQGQRTALQEQRRGRKPTRDPRDAELAQLRRDLARMQTRLAQAEAIIDVQKKLSQLLGLTALTQ